MPPPEPERDLLESPIPVSELIARRNTLTRRIVRLRMRYMSAGIPAPELQVAPLRKAVAALDRQIAKLL